MKITLSRSTLLGLGFLVSFVLLVPDTYAKLETIKYTKAQSSTLVDVVKKLQSRHYRDQKFDDNLSQAYLDKYLDSIDPSHMIFLQSDIKSFRKHARQFDNDFQKGKLNVPFNIYHSFRVKVSKRFQYVIDQLNDPKKVFDFTQDDNVEIDRSEMPWPASESLSQHIWRPSTTTIHVGTMSEGFVLGELPLVEEWGVRSTLFQVHEKIICVEHDNEHDEHVNLFTNFWKSTRASKSL